MPRLPWCALALFLSSTASAFAAQILVVDAQAPASLHKGDLIDGDKPLNIPAGAVVVLMDESGATVTITGPYSGVPGGAKAGQGPTLLQRLSPVLTDRSRADADVLGATRGLNAKAAAADSWAINVRAQGTKCVRAGAQPQFWRASSRADAAVTLARDGTSERASLTWAGGAATLAWPKEVAIIDNARYQVTVSPAAAANAFTLRVALATLAHGAAEVAWMTNAGCADQALLLARQLGSEHALDGASAGSAPLFK